MSHSYFAPGRVNLIGEHTDYNDGFVLPVALDLATTVAIDKRADRQVQVETAMGGASFSFDLDEADPQPRHDWTDYVRGVAIMLEREGYRLAGGDLSIDSTVPTGSGLSSSAALEVSVGYALLQASGQSIALPRLAQLCQKAENEFVGTRCGIMDQFISCCGEAGHALLIDCRSLDYRPVPLPDEARVVICNSMVHHQHSTGEYNLRRQECERGVELLKPALGGISALRDVTEAMLETHRDLLPELTYRRCRHVVTENARVLAAAEALGAGNAAAFGELMKQSHVSMRDDYEISCREIDIMVDLALGEPGVYGSRMTGGGFGGCTVSLVAADAVDAFASRLTERYQAATGIAPQVFASIAGPGVGPVEA
ncbi:galactokinase [Consotaella aegiceratis]|uniref:galactokinase n=1 Tax=Consotaella aegiceratis TaxID=3097961 RepID=UPI002F401E98